MNLVIAEKPQLGKAIADALPGRAETKDGVIVKGDYTIVWAYGHLLTLKEPEDYDEKYKARALEDLPIYFEPWGLKVGKDTDKKPGQQTKAQRLKQIGALLKDASCVIHAGDIDEEGQLLIDEILRWFKYKGPVKRIDTSNTTTKALQRALKRMKDNRCCEADGWSAFGRELSDAIFGFNLTRYFSAKNKTLLTVGRVQTPTLGLVVRRDAQIEGHEKLHYYELFADLALSGTKVTAKYAPNPENPNLTDGKFLRKTFLVERGRELDGQTLSGVMVTKKTQMESPPLPFNLTKLTTYCSRKWGYDPDDVMKITQSLRETYRAITYNRSDCQYLTEEHYQEAPETIEAAAANLGLKPALFDTEIKSRCFNDANVTAHFAIIPTTQRVDVSKMTERERNVYTAICNYYLAQFLPPAEKEKTALDVDLGKGEHLKASSTVILNPGYRAFLLGDSAETEKEDGAEEEEEGASVLSSIPPGLYAANVSNPTVKEKETSPPSRYTQATLAEDMTRIAKYVDDPQVKRMLLAKDQDKKGENGSIGTSATRPYIIKNLIARGYLTEKKEGKRTVLISTPKGRDFYHILPDNIKKADVTAKWWYIQEDIKVGNATPESMAKDVLATVTEVIHSGAGVMGNAAAYVGGGTGVVLGTCRLCGNPIMETDKAFSCTNKECSFVFFKDNKFLKSLGKRMTSSIVKSLNAKGKAPLKGCTSAKTGKTYDCVLKVEFGEKYPQLSIDFEDAEPGHLGFCPKCGEEMERNRFGNFSCTNWRGGCKYTIYGIIAGKKLTDANVRTLLTKGQTAELHGFKSKSGSTFDAKLVLDADGKVGFKFVDHPKKR